MSTNIDIFLCYRKLKVVAAGDKQENERQNSSAFALFRELCKQDRYKVWMDEELQIGELYQKVIYRSLITSDALLVAVTNGVSRSEWVKREISVAQAFGITLLPIGLDISENQFKTELTELRIDDHHFRQPLDTTAQTFGGQVDELARHIQSAAQFTRSRNHEIVTAASAKRQIKMAPAPDALRPTAFKSKTTSLKIRIVGGNVFRRTDLDVMVNSENDWLMMARPFDGSSISSQLRKKGRTLNAGKYVDNIQTQLDLASQSVPRPAPIGYVAATGSGAPNSDLFVDNGIQHIIHLVGVHVDETDGSLSPAYKQDQIDLCLRNIFLQLQKIVADNGQSAPHGTDEAAYQSENYKNSPVQRVFIPLLGTGSAKGSASSAATTISDALLKHIESGRFSSLFNSVQEIYIGAYFEEHAILLERALSERFEICGT